MNIREYFGDIIHDCRGALFAKGKLFSSPAIKFYFFADGSIEKGEVSLERLAEKTNCVLPTDNDDQNVVQIETPVVEESIDNTEVVE